MWPKYEQLDFEVNTNSRKNHLDNELLLSELPEHFAHNLADTLQSLDYKHYNPIKSLTVTNFQM